MMRLFPKGGSVAEGTGRGPSSRGDVRVDRRAFLRRSMAGAGSTVVFAMPVVRHLDRADASTKTRTVYRLSTHGRRVCDACKAHAANRFYRTVAATSDRAHLGCNCGVVTQEISKGLWTCYFQRGGRRNVFDLRWSKPHCPAP
jgi:hypothetical protein